MFYFYVKTNSVLTPHTDTNWMLLFINSDRTQSTGWEGFDYAVNLDRASDRKTTLSKWSNSGWTKVADSDYRYAGNQMELMVPRGLMEMTQPQVAFYFQWADNTGPLNDISGFFLNGDAAPDRRFNYSFIDTVAMTPIGQQANTNNKVCFLRIKIRRKRLLLLIPATALSVSDRAKLSIFNTAGRIITTCSIVLDETIDLSQMRLPNGYYIVEIRNQNGILGRSGFNCFCSY